MTSGTRPPVTEPRRRPSGPAAASGHDRRQRAVNSFTRATGIRVSGGELELEMPFDLPGTAARPVPARPRVRSARRSRSLTSALADRLGMWPLIILVILGVLGLAATSIMLNNVVIQRSVELGRLDETRRTLRTENALLAAEIAHLSAPPRVVARAGKRLGMEPSTAMAKFIYLDPAAMQEQRQHQREVAAKQAKVATAVAQGQALVTGEVFLRPTGADLGPRSVGGDGNVDAAAVADPNAAPPTATEGDGAQ